LSGHSSAAESKTGNHRFFYGYVVVAAAFLCMLVMWGAYYSFGIFFTPLLSEFGWTRATTSGAFSLSFVLTGLFGIFAGKLTDRFGPRKVVTICGGFLGLGYLLVSTVDAFWQLYLFYGVVVALGMSAAIIPLQSTVARWFIKRRGLMTGLVVAGIGAGMLIVPPVADRLIENYGWRTSYVVVGVGALFVIALAAQFLKRDPAEMGLLPYGEEQLTINNSIMNQGFTLSEALKTKQFWLLGLASLSFTLGEGTIMVHIVAHARGLGIPAIAAAFIITLIGGVSIGGRVIIGTAGDKIGNKISWIFCLALVTVSLFWLLLARELWMLYLFTVVFGFGYGGLSVLMSPTVAEYFGLRSHGVIFGVLIMLGGTGGMALGPLFAGYLFDRTGSYLTAFLIYAVLGVIGVILLFFLAPLRQKSSLGPQA